MSNPLRNRVIVMLNDTESERLEKAVGLFGCSRNFFVRGVLNSALDNVFNLNQEQLSFRFILTEKSKRGDKK